MPHVIPRLTTRLNAGAAAVVDPLPTLTLILTLALTLTLTLTLTPTLAQARRELGILSFSYDEHQKQMPLQVVIPKVSPQGVAEQFQPVAPDQSMAAAYQKGEHAKLMTLNGSAVMSAGGPVTLQMGSESVFEAKVRESGFWSVKFKHPLTAYQALSIAISIIHNPKTATLDTLGGGSAVAPGLEKEALALAVEARGAVDRPGPLKEAHDTYYKPLADQM